MGQARVIKTLKKKGLRIIELLSHGYIRIDGAMLTYNRWKVAFEKITIPKNISIKKKKQYFAAMDELHEYYLDWRENPIAAEAKAKKTAEAKAKKTIDSKVVKSINLPIDHPGPLGPSAAAKKPAQNHTDPIGPEGPHASTMEKDPDGLI